MVQIHSPRPLSPFPLIYLRTCAANLLDGICSATSKASGAISHNPAAAYAVPFSKKKPASLS
jgi:hypothetical protein